MRADRPKVLIIDDDQENLDFLTEVLRDRYQVEAFSDPRVGLREALAGPPDAAIIDIDMPEMDGFEVCESLRASARARETVILFLTSDAQAESMQRALRVGADDYVTKPFRAHELLNRLEFRLGQATADAPLSSGNLKIDPADQSVVLRRGRARQKIRLSNRGFLILQILLKNPGRIVTRHQLVEQVWESEEISDRAVDVQVFRIRKLLSRWNRRIESIYGQGYSITEKKEARPIKGRASRARLK